MPTKIVWADGVQTTIEMEGDELSSYEAQRAVAEEQPAPVEDAIVLRVMDRVRKEIITNAGGKPGRE